MNGTTEPEADASNGVGESGVLLDDELTARRSTSPLATPRVIRTPDAKFYFQIVVFGVGNTIFRVPRHGFEVPGTIFEALFALPPSPNDVGGIEGLSDDHPIVLDGVEEDHFRGFLGALYPFVQVMTYNDWFGALHLATMWEFGEIREKVISAMSPMLAEKDAAEIVLLAKKYRVVDWLRDAYTRLVEQPTLTLADVRSPFTLDFETIAQIFYIRSASPHYTIQFVYCPYCTNNIQGYQSCPYCSQGRSLGNRATTRKDLLQDVFKAEFDSMVPRDDHVDPPLPPVPSFEQAEIQSNADGSVSSVPRPSKKKKKKK
ncbi:hypothetical protein NLJ89_g9879 [Agrocybe chaxingu]|uniref:BTB domain-containing protein n=1 Tax=Agrocybe chaxingu TaxID=84603 RepID=A0A9W8MRE9_9AGAR|nr:hypothetical protein NLJ89_g9879 [Agrocybe chaxingu]